MSEENIAFYNILYEIVLLCPPSDLINGIYIFFIILFGVGEFQVNGPLEPFLEINPWKLYFCTVSKYYLSLHADGLHRHFAASFANALFWFYNIIIMFLGCYWRWRFSYIYQLTYYTIIVYWSMHFYLLFIRVNSRAFIHRLRIGVVNSPREMFRGKALSPAFCKKPVS